MHKILLYILLSVHGIVYGQQNTQKNPADFIPKGYILFEKITGDLNKDGLEDCVLIIKGTDKKKVIKDAYNGELDRNRRGLIVLLQKNGSFEPVISNYQCFASENEDGGVYYAPELDVEILNGNLLIGYAHGRYGSSKYTFRFTNTDFTLIGYDNLYKNNFDSEFESFDEESINLLTKKKLIRKVIKIDRKGNETFKDSWKNITLTKQVTLSAIQIFEAFKIDKIVHVKN